MTQTSNLQLRDSMSMPAAAAASSSSFVRPPSQDMMTDVAKSSPVKHKAEPAAAAVADSPAASSSSAASPAKGIPSFEDRQLETRLHSTCIGLYSRVWPGDGTLVLYTAQYTVRNDASNRLDRISGTEVELRALADDWFAENVDRDTVLSVGQLIAMTPTELLASWRHFSMGTDHAHVSGRYVPIPTQVVVPPDEPPLSVVYRANLEKFEKVASLANRAARYNNHVLQRFTLRVNLDGSYSHVKPGDEVSCISSTVRSWPMKVLRRSIREVARASRSCASNDFRQLWISTSAARISSSLN
jgi:hypothetical protein